MRLRPFRTTGVFVERGREGIKVVGGVMGQDPPEPAAEQVGLSGPNDPATLWDGFAPPLRAFLARRARRED